MATCALQLGVGGPIHLAHAARTDGGDDFVGPKTGAGGEGQGWRDYRGGS